MDKKTLEACSLSAKQKFQSFSEEEIQYLTESYNDIIEKSNITGADSRRAVREFLAQQEIALKQKKLQSVQTKAKYNDNVVPKMMSTKNAYVALKEMLGSKFSSTKSNVAPLVNIKARYENEMMAAFGRIETKYPEVMKLMRDNDLNLKLGIAKFIEGKADHGLDESGVELARTIRKAMDRLHNYKVDSGFSVSYKDNYLGKVRHPSGTEMSDIGLDKFIESAKANWNLSGYKGDVDQYLEEFYFNRVNDPNKSFWDVNDEFTAMTRLSPGRRFEKASSIEFKSAEHRMRYEHDMGQHYFVNVLKDFRESSGELAAAEVFGVNYKASFLKALSEMRQEYAEAGKIKNFDRDARVLKDQLHMAVKGNMHAPADNILGRTVDILNKITDMSKLGPLSYLSTFADWSMAAGVFSSTTGENFVTSFGRIMKTYGANFASKDVGGKVANELGFLADSYLLETISERGQEALGRSGYFDKAHHYLMKMTGLHRNDIAMKRSGAIHLSKNLAENLETKAFKDLHPPLKSALEAHGINEGNFHLLANAKHEIEGMKVLSLETLREADFKNFPGETAIQQRKAQNDLVNSLYGYLDTMTSAQVPNQGLGLKTFLGQYDPNTASGMAMKLFFKFKTYPLSVLRSYKYILETGGGKYGNLKGISYTAASALALATISDIARKYSTTGDMSQATNFRTKDDKLDADRLKNIFIRSGVTGLYGDLLLEDRPFSDNLLGPTVGIASDVVHLGQQQIKEVQGKQVYNRRGFRSSMDKEFLDFAAKNNPAAPYLRLAPIKAISQNIKELMGEL